MSDIWKEILSYVSPSTAKTRHRYCLVFGTRHGVSEFVDAIYSGFKEQAYERIVISGGATMGDPIPEAEVIATALLNRGIPQDALILEPNASNTYQNVIFSRDTILQREGPINSIAIIGKICSMRRYMMTIKKNWPGIDNISAYPVNIFSSEPDYWFEDSEFRERVLGELDRIAKYRIKGDIEEIEDRIFQPN